ncbi:MAG: hypothetical protein BA872_09185 [Desulfobacterales bacterium C00003060]|nr:MAG: hypothetical protein BA861_06505 [Desulfobacterales bacterium S3730MH5]OEU80060.1 MAG: hypothetical protein BA872_09185 [Desulfobacterales bacterium C00003060]OEU83266.1 MAG: hypothetical protein BA865_05760 [Desulfobacterales bacterium S5133MH4]
MESGCKILVLEIIFILIGLATNSLAMDDIPGKRKHDLVIIEDNELYQNNLCGIRIRGSIPVTIKACQIRSNGMTGIRSDKHSQVTVAGCNIFQNSTAGINVRDAAGITIENNRIYRNKKAGVVIWKSREKEIPVLEVKIANNRIYNNDMAGIRTMPQPDGKVDLSIVGNSIYQNKKAGVRVENNTKLTAKGNSIYDNGTAGIVSYVSTIPPKLDIYQNRVSFNRGPGIHIVNGVKGHIGIRNNWVYNNQFSGILCGILTSIDTRLLNLEIINNTVVSNGSGKQGAGIRDESKGKIIIMNNIVAYNYVTGIMTKRCKGYSYNLLFANGDVGNCCDDPNASPCWVERIQLGGCPEKGKGDIICDPLFVDPDRYNFYLQDESPAIDAGKEITICNDMHFFLSTGTSRNDMGATGGPYACEKR